DWQNQCFWANRFAAFLNARPEADNPDRIIARTDTEAGRRIVRVGGEDGLPVFAVGPDAVLSFRVFVTSRDAGDIASQGIEFVLTDKEDPKAAGIGAAKSR
ncbi:MAG: hypothetical protein VW405_10445, partial [Rhodospirillaceae bacterium]